MAETVRKTFKEKLRPTPEQERQLEAVLWRCRDLFNTALEQRITAWQRCPVSVSRYQQEAELKAIRAEMPDYAAIHSHVLQDVLARLDKTYQAFFRRVERGEKAGFPRFKGRSRYHGFTFKEYGNGARLENGALVLSKIGRISVHWSHPIAGTPKTVTLSKEADRWDVALSCAAVPCTPLPLSSQETGIDRGLESFATLADGSQIATPRIFRVAELASKRAQRRVSRRKKEGQPAPTQGGGAARQGASAHTQPAARLPSPGSPQAGAAVRRDLLRRFAGPQHGAEPLLGKEHRRCRVERVPCHPHVQGCECREASARGHPCVYQPDLLRLRRHRLQRLVRPVASVSGLRSEPSSRPHCCAEYSAAGANAPTRAQ